MLLNCDSAVSRLSLKTVALGLSQLQIFILSMCLTFVHIAALEASKRMCLLQSATRLLDDLIGMGEVFCLSEDFSGVTFISCPDFDDPETEDALTLSLHPVAISSLITSYVSLHAVTDLLKLADE